jgi:hypothetical protein
VSNDIHIYDLARHPDLRFQGPILGVGVFKGGFQVPQAVGAPLDVDDVGAVQEPVEDSRGQHLTDWEETSTGGDALVNLGVALTLESHVALQRARRSLKLR